MAFEDILYDVADGVATVTLNRPAKLNAWRATMEREVRLAMRQADADDAVRVIVLTGAGRGFCAGADMNALQTIQAGATGTPAPAAAAAAPPAAGPSPDDPYDPAARADYQRRYAYFPAVTKPIVAAINGPCAGLGLIMALYADLRFASDAASFTTAFARRGLIAEHGISWLLPRLVGFAQAADLMFSARVFRAAEAKALGLVNQVFPAESFRDEVGAYVRMLATEVSPRSLREMKRELWAAQFQSLAEATADADADMRRSFATDDFREGVAHFVEKRPARFTGR